MMKALAHIKKLKFFIAGAGKSGIICAQILKKYGAQVFVSEGSSLTKEAELELIKNQIEFEENGHSIPRLKECNVFLLSPGIPLSSPLVLSAKSNHIPVISEIELASWLLKKQDLCIGITGTNGKSTTTHYLAHLLKSAGFNARACGNIGIPFAQEVTKKSSKPHKNVNVYAVELSSYQLESTYSFHPDCSLILNLQNDHLTRYETMLEYLKAKWRLALLTKESGLVILHESVLKLAIEHGLSLPKCKIIIVGENENQNSIRPSKRLSQASEFILDKIWSTRGLPQPNYKNLKEIYLSSALFQLNLSYAAFKHDLERNSIHASFLDKKGWTHWNIHTSCLPGKHNAENLFYAGIVARHFGVPEKIILKQWEQKTSQYTPLAHRLETICRNPIAIINDSKATNVESTLVALNSFSGSIRLLIGGEPKGDSYAPIQKLLGNKILKIYPFGKAGPLIFSEIKGSVANPFPNMLAAAKQAFLESQSGDIILLSPACSSFDEFKNFEHRGEVFRQWALSYCQENAL